MARWFEVVMGRWQRRVVEMEWMMEWWLDGWRTATPAWPRRRPEGGEGDREREMEWRCSLAAAR